MKWKLMALLAAAALAAPKAAGGEEEEEKAEELPLLHVEGRPYRTPRAGEGFRTEVLGEPVTVPPQDRRSISAWDIGIAANSPGATGSEVLPFGSLYFWRNPDDDFLLRATIVGFYNDILVAKSPPGFGPFEGVFTFESRTTPIAQADLVDGLEVKEEELFWGWVSAGFGPGFRTQVAPGHQDNMFSLALLAEPSFFYFFEGSDTAADFVSPQDTFEARARLRMRWDALERNLLSLPHQGFALGSDLLYGYRADWEDWGIGAAQRAAATRDYGLLTAYFLHAGAVPGIDSDRHRLLLYLYGGGGLDLDRFSAPRLGGGPHPGGEEFGSTGRAVIPGSAIEEFTPRYYAVALAEYRWELIFFTYLSVRSSVAFLDRETFEAGGIRREDDVFASIGGRITTGFFFETRLQLDYNYNAGVVRRDGRGVHEVVMHVSRDF
jgi:hypothetical protein